MLSNLSKNRDRIKIQNIRWEEWKFLGKEVFRIKKRDKNFPRRAEARLGTRVTRARFESYYRRIKRVLKTSQEGKKIEIAKRWCWLLDGNFFFLFFFTIYRGAKLSLNATTLREREREREKYVSSPYLLLSVNSERQQKCISWTVRNVLFGSFVHSFIHFVLQIVPF